MKTLAAAILGLSAAILGLSIGTAAAAPCTAAATSGTVCVQVTEYISADTSHPCVLFEVSHAAPQYAVPLPYEQDKADTLKLAFMSGTLITFNLGVALPTATCGYLSSFTSTAKLFMGDYE
jgi:hypothetical protein